MRSIRLALTAALAAAFIVAAPISASAPARSGAAAAPTVAKAYALVQLKGAPLSTSAKTKPAHGKKVDYTSAATKAYKAQLAALRNDFKAWLRKAAPKAQIVKGYDLALNAVAVKLNGTTLATIQQSTLVARAEYEGVYRPTADDPDLGLISAAAGWATAGQTSETAGEGVRVGVIDTGVDTSHPCFSDADYPAHLQLGDRTYTNNKVIVARVFTNKVNQNGFDAEPVQEHGTHVAGTIACNFDTPATVDGAAIPYGISGVAPRALLGSYNIFPGNIEDARSEDILNALEAAYRDGMDIVNMSLGGGAHGVQDLLTVAVDNLDQANMISAVAAGNSGPGNFTVESPGLGRARPHGRRVERQPLGHQPRHGGCGLGCRRARRLRQARLPVRGHAPGPRRRRRLGAQPRVRPARRRRLRRQHRAHPARRLRLLAQALQRTAGRLRGRHRRQPCRRSADRDGQGRRADRPDHPGLDDRPRRGRHLQGPGRRGRHRSGPARTPTRSTTPTSWPTSPARVRPTSTSGSSRTSSPRA